MNFIIEPSKSRRKCARLLSSILFFWYPALRHKMSKVLMHVSLWHSIGVAWQYYLRPEPKQFKYYLSIVACCKDEGDYLQEWIEYHLLQGVEHFYLYNNNGTDNSEERLKSYIDAGIVTWIVWPGQRQQLAMYNDCVERYRNETRWLMAIDIDEFVFPLRGEKFVDILKREYASFNQVSFHWMFYGSSGYKEKIPGLVIERFIMRRKIAEEQVKSVYNPRAILLARVHYSIVLGKAVNERKEKIYSDESEITADVVRINHYVIKSYEEFSAKRKKGAVYGKTLTIDNTYFDVHDFNEVDDSASIAGMVDSLKNKRNGTA